MSRIYSMLLLYLQTWWARNIHWNWLFFLNCITILETKNKTIDDTKVSKEASIKNPNIMYPPNEFFYWKMYVADNSQNNSGQLCQQEKTNNIIPTENYLRNAKNFKVEKKKQENRSIHFVVVITVIVFLFCQIMYGNEK